MSKVLSCIICDVARKEEGQKGILIGVYTGAISAQEIPVTMPTFAIWLEIQPSKKDISINLEITSPEKKTLCKLKGKLAVGATQFPCGIPVQFGAITFPVEGTYQIKIGFGGKQSYTQEFVVLKQNAPIAPQVQ